MRDLTANPSRLRTHGLKEEELSVRVWGGMACFTRPEMPVERVSYPMMTPSAARGILEAIFWKPEFTWRITEIWVLKPIRYFSLVRNEVKSRASVSRDLWIELDRTQRHTLALRDVDYVIRAQVEVRPRIETGIEAVPEKYRAQFRRRVKTGRCFAMPYLGCREFTGFFAPPDETMTPLALDADLGSMLLDLEYGSTGNTPQFFQARLDGGVLHVPARVD